VKNAFDYREAPSAAPATAADSSADDWTDDGADASDAVDRQQWVVEGQAHGQRLDRCLADRITAFSRSHLQQLIEQGHVQLAGRACTQSSKRVQAGQAIDVELIPTAQTLAFRPQAMSLPVVFEDEHLIVIDKPAGLVVHPGAGNWSGTLLNGLLAHHEGAAQLPRAGIVHRLDKGTTGLMVVGKTLVACTGLVRAIAARDVRREYLAICHGRVSEGAFSLEGSIGRDVRSRLRMAVTAHGKPARTDVEWLAGEGRFSAVQCRLHSGRTHQIRVHLSHAGYPLVADELYGGVAALGLTRPALHAQRLAFQHPISGEALDFTAALPPDFAQAWQAVGAPMAPYCDYNQAVSSAERQVIAGTP
jgi:23S rRNA pseudouridine1911/1915/1917 synthase